MSHDVLSRNRQSGFLGKTETAVPCGKLLLLSLRCEKDLSAYALKRASNVQYRFTY